MKADDALKYVRSPDLHWWVQEGAAKPIYTFYCTHASHVTMKEMLGIHSRHMVCFTHDDLFNYIYEEHDMRELAKKVFSQAHEHYSYMEDLKSRFYLYCDDFFTFCEDLDLEGSDTELMASLSEFNELHLKGWAIGLLADHVGFFADSEVPKLLSDLGCSDVHSAFSLLSSPVKKMFCTEENLDLLKIKNADEKKLEEHARKYHWILNSYAGPKDLDAGFFRKRAEELRAEMDADAKIMKIEGSLAELPTRKEDLLKRYDDPRLRTWTRLMEDWAHIQDTRKKANLIADHHVRRFAEEVARQIGADTEDLLYFYPPELSSIIKEGIDKEELKRRKDIVVLYYLPGMQGIMSGDDARAMKDAMFPDKDAVEVDEIKGVCASSGKVRARSRIIRNSSDLHKLQKGEILVTSMTRPDFMVALKRAAGIITDEGGITCHAAIVSRELGIPCIIGTKDATKLLKDGEEVELDADSGVVRR